MSLHRPQAEKLALVPRSALDAEVGHQAALAAELQARLEASERDKLAMVPREALEKEARHMQVVGGGTAVRHAYTTRCATMPIVSTTAARHRG